MSDRNDGPWHCIRWCITMPFWLGWYCYSNIFFLKTVGLCVFFLLLLLLLLGRPLVLHDLSCDWCCCSSYWCILLFCWAWSKMNETSSLDLLLRHLRERERSSSYYRRWWRVKMVQARLWTRVFGHPVGSSLVCESVSETGKLPISVSCGLLPEKRVNIWLQDQAFLGCSIRSVTSVEVFGLCVI